MNSFRHVIAGIYVALAEAAGGPAALRRANQVLRDAIADGAVDDPTAIMLLESPGARRRRRGLVRDL
jgi:hypothetical protein